MSDPTFLALNYFPFLPQSPDIMLGLSKEMKTGQRTLSREELEINEVLNPPASGSQSANNTEKNSAASAQPEPKPRAETLSMGDFSSFIEKSVVSGIAKGLAIARSHEAKSSLLGKRTRHVSHSDSHSSQVDADLPEVGVDPVRKGSVPPEEVFGSEVNSDNLYYSDEDQESDEDHYNESNPFHIRKPSPDITINPKDKLLRSVPLFSKVDENVTAHLVDEPDVDLPPVDAHPPAS